MRISFRKALFIIFSILYIILPSYFAIELSPSLPMLTMSRILLILISFETLRSNNYKIKCRLFYKKKANTIFLIFVFLYLLSNLSHIYLADTLNNIFSFFFDGILVTWVVSSNLTDENGILKTIDILIYTSSFVAIIAIISTILGKNLFEYLITVNRSLNLKDFTRSGYLRAQAGFDHAVHYGAYCSIMAIISFDLWRQSKGKKSNQYLICGMLNIVGLFLSNSRGSLLAFLIVMLIDILSNKKITKSSLFRGVIGIGGILFLIIIVSVLFPTIKNFISNVLEAFFISLFSGNSNRLSTNFGQNANGILSRTTQFSGIKYVFDKSPMFGLGANAPARGVLKYINPQTGLWYVTDTYDVGFVEIFCNYGFVGTIAYLFLYGLIIYICFRKYNRESLVQTLLKNAFLTYFICLLSVDVSGTSKLFWFLFGIVIAFYNNVKI